MAIDIDHNNEAGDCLILSDRPPDRVTLASINFSGAIEEFYEEIIFEPSPKEAPPALLSQEKGAKSPRLGERVG
jgi:hypothetical protein